MRDELPEDCTKQLDYRALLDTLSLLEGETVCVQINGLSSRPGGGWAPRIGFVGRLRKSAIRGQRGSPSEMAGASCSTSRTSSAPLCDEFTM
jgi:hypothetical protein